MRLYLIRHGQSTNNALLTEGRYEKDRTYDPRLTARGEQQAELIARYLASAVDMPDGERFHLTHLYCSPMLRALQTTRPLAQALAMEPEIWVDLHEIGGLFTVEAGNSIASYPGYSRAEIASQFPGYRIPDNIREDGWWRTDGIRESPADFVGRAIRVALSLRDRTRSDERIALVAHAAFFDALLKALLNQAPMHPDALFYNHYNTGITRLDFGKDTIYSGANISPERMRLHYMNRVDHLPFDLRTW
jgi:2,3-bisphosphoglycerate-dependent phosphoglycerate mutase